MLRLLFWLVVLGGAFAVLSGSVPLPGIAQEEVVYATPPPVATCGPSGCIAVYTLAVGNVGRSAQELVRVRLRADAIAAPVIAPTVRRTNDNRLAEGAEDRAGVEVFPLGRMEPDEQATLLFALRAASRDAIVGWDRVLVGVDPSSGSARPGEVGALTAGRIVHAAGRITTRIVDAVRKAVAAS